MNRYEMQAKLKMYRQNGVKLNIKDLRQTAEVLQAEINRIEASLEETKQVSESLKAESQTVPPDMIVSVQVDDLIDIKDFDYKSYPAKASTRPESLEVYANRYITALAIDQGKKELPILSSDTINFYREWGYVATKYPVDTLRQYHNTMAYVAHLIQGWLDSGSPTATVNATVTKVRKLIMSKLNITPSDPRTLPLEVSLFKQPELVLHRADITRKARVNKRLDKATKIEYSDIKPLYDYAKSLILKKSRITTWRDCQERALMLGALTGRRIRSELLGRGMFAKQLGTPYYSDLELMFTGQAKKYEFFPSYPILVIDATSELVDACIYNNAMILEFVANRPWFKDDDDLLTTIVNKCGWLSSNICRGGTKLIRDLTNGVIKTPHNLRALYACYLFQTQKENNNFSVWAGRLLGDGFYREIDGDKVFIPTTEAINAYSRYYIQGL